MNSFQSSYHSMKYTYWFISVIFALLPTLLMNNAIPFLAAIVLSVIYMTYKRKRGASFVLISLALCLPIIMNMEDFTASFYNEHFKWLIRSIYACLLVSLIIYLLMYKQKSYYSSIFPPLVFISILFVLEAIRFGMDEAISTFYKVLTVSVAFYVGYRGKERWNDLFWLLSFIFIFMGIYVFLDFFFKLGPYVSMRRMSFSLLEFYRAGGLLGNSLILTGFVLAYQAILLINYQITNHLSPWLMVILLAVLITTGSRTAIIIMALTWIFFIYYLSRGTKKQMRRLWIITISCVLFYGASEIFMGKYIDIYIDRFSESSEHRLSGFETTSNILSIYPLGVGAKEKSKVIIANSADGFTDGMATLDNTYLTFLVTDGYLFFIPLLFYFFILMYSALQAGKNSQFRVIVLFFIPYALCGMSFNIDTYIQLNVLYFCLAGHMYRMIRNNSLCNNGIINYHS